jgi:hypothetical protein
MPAEMNKRPSDKLVAPLIDQKLVRQVRTRADIQVWRRDEADRALRLAITSKGKQAIGSIKMPIKAELQVASTQVESKRQFSKLFRPPRK